jgi:hypothetical protein
MPNRQNRVPATRSKPEAESHLYGYRSPLRMEAQRAARVGSFARVFSAQPQTVVRLPSSAQCTQ